MSKKPQPKCVLRLTVEVPGVWADDLDESAAVLSQPDAPGPDERLFVVTEEWMRPDVVLTICTYPGEKSLSDDFEMHTYKARVVAADTVEAP